MIGFIQVYNDYNSLTHILESPFWLKIDSIIDCKEIKSDEIQVVKIRYQLGNEVVIAYIEKKRFDILLKSLHEIEINLKNRG